MTATTSLDPSLTELRVSLAGGSSAPRIPDTTRRAAASTPSSTAGRP